MGVLLSGAVSYERGTSVRVPYSLDSGVSPSQPSGFSRLCLQNYETLLFDELFERMFRGMVKTRLPLLAGDARKISPACRF